MRIIDADALKEEICKRYTHFSQRLAISSVFEEIKKAPSLDAVQVVRCKDCKYSYTLMTARAKDGQESWTRFCDKHKTLFPKDDWFCASGERKE